MSEFHLEPKRYDAIEKAAQSAVPVTGTEPASFVKQLKGFWVTFATMFKKPNTIEYPEVKPEVQPRFHGRHQLNRYEDGLEKCIGCELCAWACPADAIYVEGENNYEENRMSPGERHAKVYQINYLRCIFCGLYLHNLLREQFPHRQESEFLHHPIQLYGKLEPSWHYIQFQNSQ